MIPGAEVAGACGGNSDVAKVAGDVARGYVHAAGKGDGEVLVIAADADAFGEDIYGGLGGTSMLVVEDDLLVDPVADAGRAQIIFKLNAVKRPWAALTVRR